MNKSTLLVGVIIAVALGAIVIVQAQNNARLRSTIGSLQREIESFKSETDKNRRTVAELKTQNEVYQTESETLRKNMAEGQTTGRPLASGESADGKAAGESAERGGFMKGIAKMFNDPEGRKAMRGQQAMAVRMMYGDLAKELGLTPEEANQMMELLIERQMSMAARSMELMGGTREPGKAEATGKAINEDRAQHDAQIKAVLGEERMKQFAEYERTVGDRMQMQQYQQAFAAAGVPLQDPQREQLMAIMKEERLKMPESPFDGSSKNVTAQVKAMQTGEGIDHAMQQMEKFNRAILPRARAILTPEQANAFEAAQKQQMEMMQFGLKMSREMLNKQD